MNDTKQFENPSEHLLDFPTMLADSESDTRETISDNQPIIRRYDVIIHLQMSPKHVTSLPVQALWKKPLRQRWENVGFFKQGNSYWTRQDVSENNGCVHPHLSSRERLHKKVWLLKCTERVWRVTWKANLEKSKYKLLKICIKYKLYSCFFRWKLKTSIRINSKTCCLTSL